MPRTLPEYYDFVQALAHSEPWTPDVIDIRLVHRRSGFKNAVCKEIVFEEITDGAYYGPSFRLFEQEAQELMDALWNCGVRPTLGKSSIGQVDAVEKHLADMRAIAFATLEIKQP
ncbi:MAG: hypothetical protein ABFC88_12720 [Thermoguttaceae bacterium]